MSTVPLKVLFFVSETAGLLQRRAKKRMPVKLGCMPASDAAEQWMVMGGEWGSEGGGGIMRLGHGTFLGEKGRVPFPPLPCWVKLVGPPMVQHSNRSHVQVLHPPVPPATSTGGDVWIMRKTLMEAPSRLQETQTVS